MNGKLENVINLVGVEFVQTQEKQRLMHKMGEMSVLDHQVLLKAATPKNAQVILKKS